MHKESVKHAQKGCLTRPCNEIRSDGSRIENTNRGLNGISRAIASGLLTWMELTGDWVLRRNIRIAFDSRVTCIASFVASTFKSHHIFLVRDIATLWNSMLSPSSPAEQTLPTLKVSESDETFGIAPTNGSTFQPIKTEDINFPGFEATVPLEDVVRENIIAQIGGDLSLFERPAKESRTRPAVAGKSLPCTGLCGMRIQRANMFESAQ